MKKRLGKLKIKDQPIFFRKIIKSRNFPNRARPILLNFIKNSHSSEKSAQTINN